MAEIELMVEPSELKSQAKKVTECIKDIEKDFKDIGRIVNHTSYWKGAASDKHKELFSNNKEDITEIINRLKEHPKDLKKMAGIYDAAEEANVAVAKSLLTDVIS